MFQFFNISTLTITTLFSILIWRMLILVPLNNINDDQPTEVEILFSELVKAGFIQVQSDASINLPPADQALVAAWNGKPLSKNIKNYINNLYYSAAGQALRHDINLWNLSRRLVAIRDNAVNLGATYSNWNAYQCDSDILITTKALVAESFGYVHQGQLRTGFSAWNAINPHSFDCVEWRGELQATKALSIDVWYVGIPILSDNILAMSLLLPPRQQTLPKCVAATIPPSQAGNLRIPASTWVRQTGNVWKLQLKLRLAPARDPSLAPQGLRVSVSPENCQPQWNKIAVQSNIFKHSTTNWKVYTEDKTLIVNEDAKPTVQAQSLGLLPLVGYGADDAHGLSGWLNSAHGGGQLILTIDSRIQALARTTMANALKKLPISPWSDERRAALILMDTDGAILAAVGFPDVPPVGKITAWDLAAFARVYPDSNPLQVRAWEGIDRHLAAGSTFKTVTALAGIAASLESPNINAMLYGLSSKNFTALTGVRLKDFQINPLRGSGSNSSRTIRNFQSEPTSYLLNKEFRAKACPDQGTDKYDLSLTSALRDSMNTWFVALSMLLDGEPKTGDKPKNTDLQFVKTMQELGLGTKQPLFLNSPSNLYETMPKAAAEQIDLLSNAPGNLRWIMAQASIGQGTLVTPLRMATIAASIAIGKQVIPHLDLVWKTANEMQPIKVATSNTNIFNSDLTLLRTGMRAVIQNGTAHTAFLKTPPSIRCHTYAKTGTAQIGRRDNTGQLEEFGSAWIIGWHQPSGIQLPLAFACLITHVKNTGGEICAPIIAEILQTISKN